MNKELLGVVVCGGQSKRMGKDKGLIDRDGKVWAQIAVEKFEALRIPVIISVNETQVEPYLKVFENRQLIVDNQNVGGPLNGLLSVHTAYPHHDLLLLACDMIDMQQEVLQQLLAAYQAEKNYDYYAYDVENVLQPFCAIYTADALKVLVQKHREEALGSSSPRYIVEHGNTQRLQTSVSYSFTNHNTLDERNT